MRPFDLDSALKYRPYIDSSTPSYSAWRWEEASPLSGTYTATASNGITTLKYSFKIDATKNMSQPVLNKSGDTISWSPVTGAGGYYYEVLDSTGLYSLASDFVSTDPLLTQYSFVLPPLPDGSYLVSVYALTTDRLALASDEPIPSPSLPSQENDSLSSIDFVVGGTGTGYALDARGGVLYEGQLYAGTDDYGIVIWTSLYTTTTPSMPPAGDWSVTVTGPGISTPISFTYPATESQFIDWEFGIVPASGTYTVTATPAAGGTSIIQTFTIPVPDAKLPIATGLVATPTTGGGASITWDAVPGANSYYVNIYTYYNILTEIAANWVSSNSAIVPSGTLTPGETYYIYVTSCELDMTGTNITVPGQQVNMSDTTFTDASMIAK